MSHQTNYGDLIRNEEGKIEFVPNPNGKYWVPPPGFQPISYLEFGVDPIHKPSCWQRLMSWLKSILTPK